MAIQSQFTSKFGVTFNSAYTVIGRLNYNKFAKSGLDNCALDTFAEGWVFADAQARQDGKEPVDRIGLNFDVDLNSDDNYVAQAYDFLKTLTAFIGSEDV